MATRSTETEVTTTWSHVVPGTLRFETEGHHANKQTVEIRTRDEHGAFDGNTRRIATSDLFQCFWTVEAKDRLDKARRSLKRQVRTGKEGASERMAALDSVEKAQVELCKVELPRIAAARAKLAEEAKADERREERKASKPKAPKAPKAAKAKTDDAALALLGEAA